MAAIPDLPALSSNHRPHRTASFPRTMFPTPSARTPGPARRSLFYRSKGDFSPRSRGLPSRNGSIYRNGAAAASRLQLLSFRRTQQRYGRSSAPVLTHRRHKPSMKMTRKSSLLQKRRTTAAIAAAARQRLRRTSRTRMVPDGASAFRVEIGDALTESLRNRCAGPRREAMQRRKRDTRKPVQLLVQER